jgi:hypothetical protein
MNFHEWSKAEMLVFPSDIKDSTFWIWNKERHQIGKTTSHYHTNFTNIFQIYIQHKTFKNIIERLVATWWNIKICKLWEPNDITPI